MFSDLDGTRFAVTSGPRIKIKRRRDFRDRQFTRDKTINNRYLPT